MEMGTIRKEEDGQSAAGEFTERDATLHAHAAAGLGPGAVWASIPHQPPLTAELEAERTEFIDRTYGAVDQE